MKVLIGRYTGEFLCSLVKMLENFFLDGVSHNSVELARMEDGAVAVIPCYFHRRMPQDVRKNFY